MLIVYTLLANENDFFFALATELMKQCDIDKGKFIFEAFYGGIGTCFANLHLTGTVLSQSISNT